MKRRTILQMLAIAPWTRLALAKQASRITVFGKLPAPDKVRQVFAAGSPAGVLTYVLAPNKLIGWPQQLNNEARSFLAPPYRGLPFLGRLAGRGSTVSVERLLELKPDFILDIGTVGGTQLSTAQRIAQQTGIAYVLVDGRLADSPGQLRDVGRLLGVARRGEQLAAYAEATISLTAHWRGPRAAEKARSIYFGRGLDGLETGSRDSINMEVIDLAGARNVAADAGKGGLTRVSLEQVLTWNPDIIVSQDQALARRIASDPLWRSLASVRAGRVHGVPSLPFGWLDGPPSANRLIGVRWLLAHLHPDLVSSSGQSHLRSATVEFYRLFYGVDVTRDGLGKILGADV